MSGLADFLLPRTCVTCDARLPERTIDLACGTCWSRIPLLPHPQCDRCGYPLPEGGDCRWCALLPPYVRAVRSVCWVPDQLGGALVHAMKYDGWHALAAGMGARMARLPWPADVVAERAALVPVPLSVKRERERGFNQSARLAVAAGSLTGLDTWHALVRTHFTSSQTRLTPEERLRNVSGAFRVDGDPARLRGAHLVLVDDVVTTAATLNACAAALFAGGARIISYVTFGRARLPGDAPPS